MVIVGDNLRGLIEHNEMCNSECYDTTCIELSLGEEVVWLHPTDAVDTLTYGREIPEECIQRCSISQEGLAIPPKTSVLACSAETIYMPMGFFGLLQTKGSLARYFVSIHFSDGQVDPGYRGKITFEIFNGSDFIINMKKGQSVGNLYVLKASTNNVKEYKGRYQEASGPTTYRLK